MDLTVADLEAVAAYTNEHCTDVAEDPDPLWSDEEREAEEERAERASRAATLLHRNAHAVVELINRLEASWSPARED